MTVTAGTTADMDAMRSNRDADAVGDVTVSAGGDATLNGTVDAGVFAAADNVGDVTVTSGGTITVNAAVGNAEDITLDAATDVGDDCSRYADRR